MHGNTRYMHCSAEHTACARIFYNSPTLDQVTDRTNHVPLCKACGSPNTPHAMFFDKSYSEHYYRGTTIKLIVEDIDGLIVVGIAL